MSGSPSPFQSTGSTLPAAKGGGVLPGHGPATRFRTGFACVLYFRVTDGESMVLPSAACPRRVTCVRSDRLVFGACLYSKFHDRTSEAASPFTCSSIREQRRLVSTWKPYKPLVNRSGRLSQTNSSR